MGEYVLEGMVSVSQKLAEIGKEAMSIMETGRAVEILVQPYSEKEAEKRRSNAMNRLIYLLYQRISKTLYGGDELHTRRECKLLIGCRILRRDSESFADIYDTIIRVLSYENKLKSMDLISVSSIMSVKQGAEYIKRIIETYTEKGCYFADIEGLESYLQYPESNNAK